MPKLIFTILTSLALATLAAPAGQYLVMAKRGPMVTMEARSLASDKAGTEVMLVEHDNPDALLDHPHVLAVETNRVYHTLAAPGEWWKPKVLLERGRSHATDDPPLVAVTDTGVAMNHPKLALGTVPGEIPGDGMDNDKNGFIDDTHGWDFADDSPDVSPHGRHGTHVQGIVASDLGVSPKIPVIHLVIFGHDGGARLSEIVAALDYAQRTRVNIINASWGGGGESTIMRSVIKRFDGLFIAAAGNSGGDTPLYPAGYDLPNVIAVSAYNERVSYPFWTNRGADICAPGDNILSTLPDSQTGTLSGTSMAAPVITGASALWWQGDWRSTKKKILSLGADYPLIIDSRAFMFLEEVGGATPGQDPGRSTNR